MGSRNHLNHLLAGNFRYCVWKMMPGAFKAYYRAIGKSPTEIYSIMQKDSYEAFSRIGANRHVVGCYDAHEQFDYETPLLVPFAADTKNLVVLDFACGPGRMVKRMSKLVAQCDGIDISAENIRQAKEYCADTAYKNRWYVNNGRTFDGVDSDTYDLIFSTIALQHIAIHAIRHQIFAEMFRVLKPGGWLSLQMGYGRDYETLAANAARMNSGTKFARWSEDAFEAEGTNSAHDVAITNDSLPEIQAEFESLGFEQFAFELTPPPHKTPYESWIFMRLHKPLSTVEG